MAHSPTLLAEHFLHLVSILRTTERLCVNRVKSFFSKCRLLLGSRFEPRPNSRALGSAGSVITDGLSTNGCSHSENKFDPGLTTENEIDRSRSSSMGEFKGLTQFRQSLLVLLLTQKDRRDSACRVWPTLKEEFCFQKDITTQKNRKY